LAKLTQEDPHSVRYQAALGSVRTNLGNAYQTLGLSEKAEAVLKEAEKTYRVLASSRPEEPDFRFNLGMTAFWLGWLYCFNFNQVDRAEEAHQRALHEFEKLAQEHPDVIGYAAQAGTTYGNLAMDGGRAGHNDLALARYDKAIEILERVVARGLLTSRKELLDSRMGRAALRIETGDYLRSIEEVEAIARQGSLDAINIYNIACVYSRAVAAVEKDKKLKAADRDRLKKQYAERAMEYLHQSSAKGQQNPALLKNDADLNSVRGRVDFQELVKELEQKTKK
jgi:tetratricopeptide (TPR) repeat protein